MRIDPPVRPLALSAEATDLTQSLGTGPPRSNTTICSYRCKSLQMRGVLWSLYWR